MSESLVSLPPEYVATKVPGYFWNTTMEQLFSIKSGILRPLKINMPSKFIEHKTGIPLYKQHPYYQVSHKGQRKLLFLSYLKGLRPEKSMIAASYPITMEQAIQHHNNWFNEGNGKRLGQFLIGQLSPSVSDPSVYYEEDNETAWVKFTERYVVG